MNTGKTLFAQLMDFLPWTTFTRIVDRYGGDHRVRTLSCAEQYRSMAFAQLTYRESLRDIETCLSVHASKLYHMGFRQPVRRSTLADANERRDWRIHAALAQRLITQARTLYVDEELGLDLTNTVYALDSTTIALCLSVFPWAHFRTTKAAVKMHTLLDLRGNIPSFIHISDGKLHDVHALDMLLPEAGAIYVVDRGYVDFARLYVLHQAGAFFVTRAKSNIDAHRVYSAPTDRSTGIICDQTISLDGFYTRQDYPELLRRIRFKDPESGKTLVFITNNFSLPAATICALYKSRWQVELFFKWIKQHLRIKQFYGTSENAVKTQIWIAVSVYVLVAIVKKRLDLDASLYTFAQLLQILSVTLFEKMPIHQALAGDDQTVYALDSTTIALCLSVFPWAHFRTTKAAVKMHTLLDLRGNIPSFIHISDASCTTFMPSICSCRKPEPSTSWIVATSTLPAFMCCTKPGPSSSRVPSTRCSSRYSAPRIARPIICDQTISLDGFYTRQDYPELLRRIRFKDPECWSSSPTTSRFRPPPSARSTKAAWNSSSSGSSSIFGSSSSTARRRTR